VGCSDEDDAGYTSTMPMVLKNLVLYSPTRPGNRYRQIAIVKRDAVFEVRIFGGDVDPEDPDFIADNPDADVDVYRDLAIAYANVERERLQSIIKGWKLQSDC
jgi:hypothetical protein